MAVFVFDSGKDQVSVVIERGDSIHIRDGSVTNIESASNFSTGHIFAQGELNVVMIRGERV